MLKRVGWGKQREATAPIHPQVPEFGMEDLPLGKIAALVPEFAVKDLPLGRALIIMISTVTLCFAIFLLYPFIL